MKIRLLLWPALALPAVSLLAACATGGTFADIRAERDQLVTLDTTLKAAGKLPSADLIAPDAQLVGFPYTVPADTVTPELRDTLVGPDNITGWLRRWHARQLPDVDFILNPTYLRACDGVAIQEGQYPIKGVDEGGVVEHQPYRAVWIQKSDGTWMLHRLWLKPDSRGHLSGPVTGCHTLGSVVRDLDRKVVEVQVFFLDGTAVTNQVADAMRGAGWTYMVGEQSFPNAGSGAVGFAADFLYRLTPAWGFGGFAIQNPDGQARGRFTTVPREPRLHETEQWLGLLGSFTYGPARFAAGPALARVGFDWSEKYSSVSGVQPVSVSGTHFGGVAQLGVSLPWAGPVHPEVVARYTFAEKAQVPAFMGLGPLNVSLDRFTIGVGMAYSF